MKIILVKRKKKHENNLNATKTVRMSMLNTDKFVITLFHNYSRQKTNKARRPSYAE